MDMQNHKAYRYCLENIDKETTPKYVNMQLKIFKNIWEDNDEKYCINKEYLETITNLLYIFNNPLDGKTSMYEWSTKYQILVYIAIFCVCHRDDIDRLRYKKSVISMGRRGGKTTIAAMAGIISMLTNYGKEFYSISHSLVKSCLVLNHAQDILRATPKVMYLDRAGRKRRFYCSKKAISNPKYGQRFCALTNNVQKVKDCSHVDGYTPQFWVADEVATFNSDYYLRSLTTGQRRGVENPSSIIISTKYHTYDNPFEWEINKAKDILDGKFKNDTTFSLIYEPDKELLGEQDRQKKCLNNDLILFQANPVFLEDPKTLETCLEEREEMKQMPEGSQAQLEFITKTCNVVAIGLDAFGYVPGDLVRLAEVDDIDWTGRSVWLGVDLSRCDDNSAVAMIDAEIGDKILMEAHAFIPERKIDEKSDREHVNYKKHIKQGNCSSSGIDAIDYKYIVKYIFELKERYKLKRIKGIVYDQAMSHDFVESLTGCGIELYAGSYNGVKMTQVATILKERILNRKFQFSKNELLQINFQNTKCTYGTNMTVKIEKKAARGKMDMVMAGLLALQGPVIIEKGRSKVKRMATGIISTPRKMKYRF